MKTVTISFVLLVTAALHALSQVPGYKFWVQLTDKKYSSYSLDKPEEFLSQRAIARRDRQGITIGEQDLPVSLAYLDSLREHPLKILYTSRWMNAAVIQTEDSSLARILPERSFVEGVEYMYRSGWKKKSFLNKQEDSTDQVTLPSDQQLEMLQGHLIHQMGYRGEGMVIAVLDAGFMGADTNPGFDSLRMSGRILGKRSFVEPDSGIYWTENGSHGTNVLSIMGGEIPGFFMGSAPKASYWLIQTEDIRSEFRIEEANWLAGAELADSAGADVINCSLGYSIGFSDPRQNYAYPDMDGKTALVTRAAQMAANRGILVVTSAGNSGRTADPWGYVTAPADGDSVLAVGAVDAFQTRADFSSRGPTADRRFKPDVMAQGVQTVLINFEGMVVQGNGTSYSSPVIAGLAACLWQKTPEISNYQLLESIRESASLNPYPDTLYGYGIPNFTAAKDIITGYVPREWPANEILLYPNPSTSEIYIAEGRFSTGRIKYRICDTGGRICLSGTLEVSPGNKLPIPVHTLQQGSYILSVTSDRETGKGIFIKVR